MSIETPATPVDQFRATIQRSIEIDAPPAVIFESILAEMRAIPDGNGKPMDFKLEPWPGGRWFRDLGNDAGHFWGHVQVIKPPTLIEVFGPLMVSGAAISHVAYRVAPSDSAHRLTITHKIFGDFDAKVPDLVGGGWQRVAERIQAHAMASTR